MSITIAGLAVVVLIQHVELQKHSKAMVLQADRSIQPAQSPRPVSHQPEVVDTETVAGVFNSAAVEKKKTPKPVFSAAERMLKIFKDMERDPSVKEAKQEIARIDEIRLYRPLLDYFASQGIDPEKFDALIQLLGDRKVALDEFSHGTDERTATRAEYDQKIRELLGEDEYALLQEYRNTQKEREWVQSFKGELPEQLQLSDDQEHYLVRILYEEKGKSASGLSLNFEGRNLTEILTSGDVQDAMLEKETDYYVRVENRAADILSETQHQRLKEAHEEKIIKSTLNAEIMPSLVPGLLNLIGGETRVEDE